MDDYTWLLYLRMVYTCWSGGYLPSHGLQQLEWWLLTFAWFTAAGVVATYLRMVYSSWSGGYLPSHGLQQLEWWLPTFAWFTPAGVVATYLRMVYSSWSGGYLPSHGLQQLEWWLLTFAWFTAAGVVATYLRMVYSSILPGMTHRWVQLGTCIEPSNFLHRMSWNRGICWQPHTRVSTGVHMV